MTAAMPTSTTPTADPAISPLTDPVAPNPSRRQISLGVLWTLLSAAAFGGSGPLAKSLLDLGWSPAALVSLRLGGASLVLIVPAALSARSSLQQGRWRLTRRTMGRLIGYGTVATGGAQLCFFSAVRYLPIGTAILLEFSAPIWLIVFYAVRQRRRPARTTVLAAVLAVLGLSLVLDVLHAGAIDLRGLAWGLGAAACLCGYYLLSDDGSGGTGEAAPPLVVATAGTAIGGLLIGTVGVLGVLPMHAATGRTTLGGASLPWLLPAALLILLPTVIAYTLGIVGVRRLGGAAASFVGLAEVVFSVLFSIALVGQHPGSTQIVGMVLVVAGIAVAQRAPAR